MSGKYTCIGLTGMMASGKGEVVKVLENYGYKYISLSDIVREEVKKAGKSVTRSEMQDIGNKLRTEGGPGVLGKMIREKISASDVVKWAIDGIRNPHEVSELRKLDSFLLVAVRSERELILKRIKKRMRNTDIADDSVLNNRLDREWGIGEPEGGQQVGKCFALSDYIIDNNGSIPELREAVQKIIETTEEKYD